SFAFGNLAENLKPRGDELGIDDECREEGCALEALQRRGARRIVDEEARGQTELDLQASLGCYEGSAPQYYLNWEANASTFFKDWTFVTHDPSWGAVNYLKREDAQSGGLLETYQVKSLINDQEGEWIQLSLTGSPDSALKEWRKRTSEEFYVNRKPLPKALDPTLEGLFDAHDVREVDPTLEWKSNLVELMRQGDGLPGLEAVAQELGYGRPTNIRETAAPPPREDKHEEGFGPKKIRGRARVRDMVKKSMWSWRGSSLDPGFKRPRIGLKRKREKSSSSGSSEGTLSLEASDQEDLFPEEAQARHIARKCPGLLTRYAIKEARKRLLTAIGEGEDAQTPKAVFVKYYRQVIAHSGASTPMKREYLTLATCLDAMLEGSILKSLDVAVQRLKSIEQISQGIPPQFANRLELIPAEVATLASTEESRTAVQEQRREEKVRSSWVPKGKGKMDSFWHRPWEDVAPKGDKGSKSGKGNQKGKAPWKGRPPKGVPAAASEVIQLKE
ncbi:unnamed protein product, partial [Symbiodinium microadriaticum]